VCSAANLGFAVEVVWSTANLKFVAKLCVLQRIWDSLLKLSCLQQINIRCRIVCSTVKLCFVAEVVLFVVNL